jgi:hypothetical protein
MWQQRYPKKSRQQHALVPAKKETTQIKTERNQGELH